MSYRAGFVAIVGRPSVGKSTLLNRLLGQKVAITSERVQTTRQRIRGVYTQPDRGQIVFWDTPGFSKALDTLGHFLVVEGEQALTEADCLLMVVDASQPPGKGDAWLAGEVRKTGKFVLLVLNKLDQCPNADRKAAHQEAYRTLFDGYPSMKVLGISALTGKRVAEVPKILFRHLPAGPPIYDEAMLTDQHVRVIAQEMIREKVMRLTEEELPHRVAVLVESFDESDPQCIRIAATLYVDQDSQKGMLIGRSGQMLEKIGRAARKEIEALVQTRVFLDLHVKVKRHWRRDPVFLRQLGLPV